MGGEATGRARIFRLNRRRKALLAVAITLGLLLAAVRERMRLVVERVTITLARLPKAFDGTTVAVVADLHAGRGERGVAAVRDMVARINRLHPDMVFLLGDLIHRPQNRSRCLPELSQLRAPRGVFAVLGNHEHGIVWYTKHFGGARSPSIGEWRRTFADAGVVLLANEARPMMNQGARLWLAGVDDAYSGRHNLAQALKTVNRRECCLVITHSPDLVDDPRIGEVDLTFAGHTHGGQVRLPWVGALFGPYREPRARSAGLISVNGTKLYVTRGLDQGPVRIGCPREITLVTLRRGSGPQSTAKPKTLNDSAAQTQGNPTTHKDVVGVE